MKTIFWSFFVLLIFIRCTPDTLVEDPTTVTIHVTTPGSLPLLIDSIQSRNITTLVVSGLLNGTDIRFIRRMASIIPLNMPTSGKLAVLDLTHASIVSGGDSYYSSSEFPFEYYTRDSTIGGRMFYNCTQLNTIKLPFTVNAIEKEALALNFLLSSVTIPDGIDSIGRSFVRNCPLISSVHLPKSVTYLAPLAFERCLSLAQIDVDSENASYCSVNGVLFNRDTTNVLVYPIEKKDSSYAFPDAVTTIQNDFKTSYGYLKNIFISKNVNTISESVLKGLYKLSEINVDERNVVFCSEGDVLFSKDKTSLLKYASKNKRTSYSIPNGVQTVNKFAFYGCDSLKSMEFPTSVSSLDDSIVLVCSKLNSVTLSSSLTSLHANTFVSNPIMEVHFKSSIPPTIRNAEYGLLFSLRCRIFVPIGASQAYLLNPDFESYRNAIEEE